MSLLDEIQAEVDPRGWNTANKYDAMLLRAHPLEWKPRKKDNKLRISWSLLKSGLHCPRSATRTVYPERFNVPEDTLKFTESLSSLRGNFAQTLLEHTYAHKFLDLPAEEFAAAMQASWRWGVLFYKPLRTITPKELIALRTEIFSTLPTIFETMNTQGFWAKTPEVEKPLWWDVPSFGGVRLTGKADFVLQDPGKYWLIDGKWVSNPSTLDARQLCFYALILSKMTGKTPTKAAFWLYPQGEVLDYSSEILGPEPFHRILQDVATVAHQIIGVDDTPNPSSYNCKWCPHKGNCPEAC